MSKVHNAKVAHMAIRSGDAGIETKGDRGARVVLSKCDNPRCEGLHFTIIADHEPVVIITLLPEEAVKLATMLIEPEEHHAPKDIEIDVKKLNNGELDAEFAFMKRKV